MSSANQPHVLLIEPHPDLRELLTQVLEEQRYAASAAAELDSALQLLEHTDVGLVLADLHEFAGPPVEAARELKAAAAAPVGLTTTDRPSADEIAQQGFDFMLLKPFSIEEFLAAVGRHVGSVADPARAQTVIQYFELLSHGKWSGLGGLCTADVQYHLPGTDPQFSRSVHGREAFCAFAEETFRDFPEASFTLQEQIPLPSGAIGRFLGRWKRGPLQPAEMAGSILFQFDGNLISEIGVRVDLQRMLSMIGLSHSTLH